MYLYRAYINELHCNYLSYSGCNKNAVIKKFLVNIKKILVNIKKFLVNYIVQNISLYILLYQNFAYTKQ